MDTEPWRTMEGNYFIEHQFVQLQRLPTGAEVYGQWSMKHRGFVHPYNKAFLGGTNSFLAWRPVMIRPSLQEMLEDYERNTPKKGRAMGVEETLAERGARYGDFTDRAEIAQLQQDLMRAAPGWQRLSPDKRQALTVIADKIARILTGDPEYMDNWHDIQGYAKLAEDRCGER